jgi:hypothetical protein
MGRSKMKVQTKVLGWVGFTDDKPYWESCGDDYSKIGETFQATNIFKSKKEARKRFQDVRPVVVVVSR